MREHIFRKLKSDRGGVSRREVLLVTLISLMVLFFVYEGYKWYRDSLARGDDKMMVNTAESVGRVNSNNGLGCVVDGCRGGLGGHCEHWNGFGYVGYFDNVGNCIVGKKPRGYNEYPVMEVDGKKYYGERGTMVIRVYGKDANVTLSWEPGKS